VSDEVERQVEVEDQCDVVPATLVQIMSDPAFAAGVADVRAGRPTRFDEFDCWQYERGRQWATLAPITMPLHIRGKLNRKAIALLLNAFASEAIR
jgi:hypothetical protein